MVVVERTGRLYNHGEQSLRKVYLQVVCAVCIWKRLGRLRRLENLENENGHGKVMEHEKLAKSHGIF